MPLSDLPADLADPLHMAGPEGSSSGWLLALALLAAALLSRRIARRRRSAPAPQRAHPAPAPSPPPAAEGLEAEIQEVRSMFSTTGNFREGCHALAEVLRRGLGRRNGVSFATLTAREIQQALGEGALPSLFGLLADLQFRPAEPARDDFLTVCDLAADTASTTDELRGGR